MKNKRFLFLTAAVLAPTILFAQFRVQGRFLKDTAGNNIVFYGVNVPIYGSGWKDDLDAVAQAIKNNTKANAVRMLWYSAKGIRDIALQNHSTPPPYYSRLANLDKAISLYASLKMLPVVYLSDLTDLNDYSIAGFNKYIVPFWTSPAVIQLIKKHKNHLIINLEDEWGATWDSLSLGTPAGGNRFVNTYTRLIRKLRQAGVSVPIMIDAPDGGSNGDFLVSVGQRLLQNDPLHNLLLSVHTYWTKENGLINHCPSDYTHYIQRLKNSNLPFVLGEVSNWSVAADGQDFESVPPVDFSCAGSSSNKYIVNYDALLTDAVNNQVGFFAWAWYQDGLIVRNIYEQENGLQVNNQPNAGNWPRDMLSNTKPYGLNNSAIQRILK